MKLIPMEGKRFGHLTVIAKSKTVGNRNQVHWDCVCICGKEKSVKGDELRRGGVKSCGCHRGDTLGSHRMSKSRIYRIWRHMKSRCYNPNVESYPYYGGKGITVCEEWQRFEAFRDWSMANGYDENRSIDRIDNSNGYFPQNCRWSTDKEQARNTTRTVCNEDVVAKVRAMFASGVKNKDIAEIFGISRTNVSDIVYHKSWAERDREYAPTTPMLTFNGETKTATDWQRDPRTQVSMSTILARKRRGMSDEDALFSPKKTHSSYRASSYVGKNKPKEAA